MDMQQHRVDRDAGPMTDYDVHLFREGRHSRLYKRMGAHAHSPGGTRFSLWAPNARKVSVIGDFNAWNGASNPLQPRLDHSGIWEGIVQNAVAGMNYKYRIVTADGSEIDKSDPFATYAELPSNTASRIWSLEYDWRDSEWMSNRCLKNKLNAPFSVYELHLGSWQRDPKHPEELLTYRDIAHKLADYVCDMGFTHVELMPICEHPFYGSWGYQTTGYFAPTARYGSPQDFMYFVDYLHQRGIGVILDWVPSHFPNDAHGLYQFDGTHLFEHADPRQGFHPEWKSCIFNYGRHEVRSFLCSSALFWLDNYHIDGLRVDAVASMLYLDYARSSGEWVPNATGGNENTEAVIFLRMLNEVVYAEYPDVQMIAEESTAWPQVSRPVVSGGLGFGMKWDMGWMHDTLNYLARPPVYRQYHQHELTFSLWYAYNENYMLPLSHDEVVHGKRSLLEKMPGDDWQRFANLRALYGLMWAHPGKKLLFMGGEFAQRREWRHDHALDWHLLDHLQHEGVQQWVRDLNHSYRERPALYERDFSSEGFSWIDFHDSGHSVIAFLRNGSSEDAVVLAVCNFTPVPRHAYRLGVPKSGFWREFLNSDALEYGGSGVGNYGGVHSEEMASHGHPSSLVLTLPPLSVILLESAN